jgi:hypothetical protein
LLTAMHSNVDCAESPLLFLMDLNKLGLWKAVPPP